MKFILVEGDVDLTARFEYKISTHSIFEYAPYASPLLAWRGLDNGKTYIQKYYKTATGSGSIVYVSDRGLGGPLYSYISYEKIVWSGGDQSVFKKTVYLNLGDPDPDIDHVFDGVSEADYTGRNGLLLYSGAGSANDLYGRQYSTIIDGEYLISNRELAGWEVIESGSEGVIAETSGFGFKKEDQYGSSIHDGREVSLSDEYSWSDFITDLGTVSVEGPSYIVETSDLPIGIAWGKNQERRIGYRLVGGLWIVETDGMLYPETVTESAPETDVNQWRIVATDVSTAQATFRLRRNRLISRLFSGGVPDISGVVLDEKVVEVDCDIQDGDNYVSEWNVQIGDTPEATWFLENVDISPIE